MVKAFAQMATAGDNVTTADFADGIWTGLLTTVAGLLVAIPVVVASRMFEAKVDKLASDLNQLSSHLKEYFFIKTKIKSLLFVTFPNSLTSIYLPTLPQ